MFCKLALKNVRKSMRDYLIYFLTLTFGVCLFYLFNSLDSQTSMMALNQSKKDAIRTLVNAINYVSVFVAVVLGFLVVYANGFLVRRRKKELGLYLTLGMNRGRVSRLLILETFFIGLFALAAGIVAGIFLSQGFSVVTAKLFETNLSSFRFVFSPEGLRKTLLYFGVIFLVVMIFNAASVSRLKLIDLLYGKRKNETLRLRNLWLSVVLFVISVGCLVYAYALILQNGMASLDWKFTTAILLGCIGTLLFFYSLSGFLLRVTQGNKRLYYRGLNMFTLRQFNSKINTTFVSVSVICLMLLVTMGTLSTGMGLANALSANVRKSTPYDAAFLQYADAQTKYDIAEKLKKDGVDLSAYASGTAQIAFCSTNVTIKDLHFSKDDLNTLGEDRKSVENETLFAIAESEYNRAAKLQNKPEISLGTDGFAVVNTIDLLDSPLNRFLEQYGTLRVGGKELKAVEQKTLHINLATDSDSGPLFSGTIIVPDAVAEKFDAMYQVLNVNFKSGADPGALEKQLASVYGYASGTSDADKPDRPYTYFSTRQEIRERQASTSTMVAYIAIYIGIVFLVAGAAVLAIQQLSESADNAERYGLLRELGADERMVNRALFKQIGLYFLFPLSLAIVHSAVGIRAVNTTILRSALMDIGRSTFAAVLIFVVIYGAYFLATYYGSKSILRQKSN